MVQTIIASTGIPKENAIDCLEHEFQRDVHVDITEYHAIHDFHFEFHPECGEVAFQLIAEMCTSVDRLVSYLPPLKKKNNTEHSLHFSPRIRFFAHARQSSRFAPSISLTDLNLLSGTKKQTAVFQTSIT